MMAINNLIATWYSNNPGSELTGYSPLLGSCTIRLEDNTIVCTNSNGSINLDYLGRLNGIGNCIVFPSEFTSSWEGFDTSSNICPFKKGDCITDDRSVCYVKSVDNNIVSVYFTITNKQVRYGGTLANWKDYYDMPLPESAKALLYDDGYYLDEEGELKYDNNIVQFNSISKQISALYYRMDNQFAYLQGEIERLAPKKETSDIKSYISKYGIPTLIGIAAFTLCIALKYIC